ncbi:PREDICTED: sex-determining region Y protein-like, partial [Polistes dominula]|uniref:Sex-determining region Y protein-like n=1 Tax=Polistes dominula TaxID=743375 RepID=A0ABM1IKN7_POLDO
MLARDLEWRNYNIFRGEVRLPVRGSSEENSRSFIDTYQIYYHHHHYHHYHHHYHHPHHQQYNHHNNQERQLSSNRQIAYRFLPLLQLKPNFVVSYVLCWRLPVNGIYQIDFLLHHQHHQHHYHYHHHHHHHHQHRQQQQYQQKHQQCHQYQQRYQQQLLSRESEFLRYNRQRCRRYFEGTNTTRTTTPRIRANSSALQHLQGYRLSLRYNANSDRLGMEK